MADHRHKRETNARRIPRASLMAAPFAVLVTLSAVSVGVATGEVPIPDSGDSLLASGAISESLPERAEAALSRSFDRSASTGAASDSGQLVSKGYQEKLLNRVDKVETRRAVRRADEKLWASEDLNLWTDADKSAKKAGEVEAGDKLLVTGRTKRDRAEVVLKGDAFWVTAEYLSDDEPIAGIGGELHERHHDRPRRQREHREGAYRCVRRVPGHFVLRRPCAAVAVTTQPVTPSTSW